MPEGLRVRGLSTSWAGRPFLRSIDLEVRPGESLALMGPNGSGKTTLLRAIAGLEPVTEGEVEIDGERVDPLPVHRRRIGFLFQDPVMLPRRTVWENVAYGPQLQRRPAADVESEARRWLDRLRLGGLADRAGDQLSGGERQRVALARTLAAQPRAVLLDEPFASVDPELRAELRAEFRRTLAEHGGPVIHVTHDREEGLFLGDRVALMDEGEVRQVGTPEELLARPVTERLARFLGYNIVREGPTARGVAPEELSVEPGSADGRTATVIAVGWLPRGPLVYLREPGGELWEGRGGVPTGVRAGESVTVRFGRSVPIGAPGPHTKSA